MKTQVRIPRISVKLVTVEHICNFSGSYCKNWAQENPQELTGYKVWHRQQLMRNPIPSNGEGKDGNPLLSSDLHRNAMAHPYHNQRSTCLFYLECASAHTHNMQTIVTISAHMIFSASHCDRRQWCEAFIFVSGCYCASLSQTSQASSDNIAVLFYYIK